MVKIETNGRELREAISRLAGASGTVDIDGMPEPLRPRLASALGAASGLLDIASDVDRQDVLEALVSADQVVVSVERGDRVPAPDHGNPSEHEAADERRD
jgi:hypothetical protein